jgi:hypothetical protein
MKIPFSGNGLTKSCIQDLPPDRDSLRLLQRCQPPGNALQVRLTSIIPRFKGHSKRKV